MTKKFSVDADRHVIRLVDPLPCSIRNDDRGICGNDAFVAYANPFQIDAEWSTPGRWILQPICEECTRKMMEVYNK